MIVCPPVRTKLREAGPKVAKLGAQRATAHATAEVGAAEASPGVTRKPETVGNIAYPDGGQQVLGVVVCAQGQAVGSPRELGSS